MLQNRAMNLRAVAVCALAALAGQAWAQSTVFTYQGQLKQNGQPADGQFDFTFKLFDAASGGNQKGSTVTQNNLNVADGLFTTQLDFGTQFDGGPRWLEISVEGAPLTPRQPLTATPYALYAFGGPGGSGPWQVNGASAYYNGGNIGIGTSTPPFPLSFSDVTGDKIALDGSNATGVFDGFGTQSGVFQMFSATVNNDILFGHGRSATFTENVRFKGNGRVGIGTAAPAEKLSVAGKIESTSGGFKFPDGTTQVTAATGGTGFWSANGNNIYNNNGGIVGINTVPYAGKLHVWTNSGFGIYARSDGDLTNAIAAEAYGGSGAVGIVGAAHHVNALAGRFTNYNGGTALQGYTPAGGQALQGVALNGDGVSGEGTNGHGVIGITNSADKFGLYCRNNVSGGAALFAEGKAIVHVLQILGGSDLAEGFDIAGNEIKPGMVTVIDPANPGQLKLSTEAYDKKVAGVISGANNLAPGMVMKAEGAPHADGEHPVALTGRVWCYADAAYGPIEPGDRLTTSATPGHAMKADDETRAAGAVIGKAMTSLKGGKGMVLVLVQPQ